MFDQTETACVLAGVAAIGTIYALQFQNRPHYPVRGAATECSARHGKVEDSGVSARVASVEETSDLFEDGLWNNMSPEGKEAMMKNPTALPNRGKNTEATRNNLKAVQPILNIQPTHSKILGTKPLVAGRSGHEAQKLPDVTGGCMFFMSEGYADRLRDQETKS